MLPDSWFTLQLLSELCENMLLQSRSWLCILFLTEQYFPHQEKEVIVLSLALEEVIGGTLFCSQSQVSGKVMFYVGNLCRHEYKRLQHSLISDVVEI